MRNLLLLLPVLLFACSAEPAATSASETTPEISSAMPAPTTPDSLLRHVVMFSFLEESYPAGVAQVEEAFIALAGKIPEIKDLEWGVNNSPEGLDKGFTHLFFVTFASEEDRAVYLPHPDHLAFVEVLKPHLKEVMVLDYWAK